MVSGRYDAIVELTRVLNDKNSDASATQQQTQQILLSLFPSWLPPAFKVAASSSNVPIRFAQLCLNALTQL